MYVVFVRKAGKAVCVFRHSAMQVGRYSDIEHRMRGIRQDVCVTSFQLFGFCSDCRGSVGPCNDVYMLRTTWEP